MRSISEELYCSSLETQYIVPSLDYITTALKAPSTLQYLRTHRLLLRSTPLYMITGVKVARGASMLTQKLKKTGTHTQIGVNLAAFTAAPITVGGKTGLELGKAGRTTWDSEDDFVYAYRLRKLMVSRKGEIRTQAYNKGAMLSVKKDEVS